MTPPTSNATPLSAAGPSCWCGNRLLEEFDANYLHCPVCETLVYRHSPGRCLEHVSDAASDYYGKEYWFERQTAEFGDPPLPVRAREDLSRRCVYWLRALLRYRRPPGRVLELGCAHGGFSALLHWSGFDAQGLELSPTIARWATERFGIPVLSGPVEEQQIADGTLDAIVLFDVLEHLPDPAATLRHCVRLLAPGGILLIQTPVYPAGATRADLEAAASPFLKMLLPLAHLHLFSQAAVTRLVNEAGLANITFETPCFQQYDMFFAASRQPLVVAAAPEIAAALEKTPSGRLVLALLDLDDARLDAETRYFTADADRTGRAAIIVDLERRLAEAEGQPQIVQARSWRIPVNADRLKRLLIDLTPMLPGGENGGAKPLTIEIIRALARVCPEMEIHVLHKKSVEQELTALAIPNLHLHCLDAKRSESKNAFSKPLWHQIREWVEKELVHYVPLWLRRRLRKPYEVLVQLSPADPITQRLNADLLFCPFTAPFFHNVETPTVCLVHDLQFFEYPEFFSSEARAERERHFRLACRCARRVVTVSEFVRGDVIARTGMEPERVVAIPNSIQSRLEPPPPPEAARTLSALNLAPESYLLYPANFWPHKNHRMLLTAFGLYRKKHPGSPLKLVLTGQPGPLRDEVLSAVREMGLSERVILPGFLPDREFAALLANCAAVIFPSLYEGFGIPILEAMAAGKPVLSSNRTSLPEVAGDGVRFFDPRRPDDIVAAIESLESEPKQIASLVNRGSQRLLRMGDSVVMAYRYLDVFLAACGEEAVFEDYLQGLWNDGWCGEYLILTTAPSPEATVLELELTCPKWFPGPEVGIHVSLGGGNKPHVSFVERGKRAVVTAQLDPAGGVVELFFTPAYTPYELGHSGDTRRLSCYVHRCTLRRPGGARMLWPEEAAAKNEEAPVAS